MLKNERVAKKLIVRTMKLKNNYFRFFLFLCCGIAIVLQPSCNENDDFMAVKDHSTYLSINIKDNQMFSYNELSILKDAYERLNKYVKNEDGKWGLTITSGKDVNMSETLFQFIKEHIELANRQNEIYALLEERGIEFQKPKHLTLYNNSPRLKLRSEEGDPPRLKDGAEYERIEGLGYVMEIATLDHDKTIQVLNAKQAAASDISQFASTIGFIFGFTPLGEYVSVGAYFVGTYAWLEGSQFAAFEANYNESGSTKGLTLVTTTYYMVDGGLPVTTYFVQQND